MTLSDAEGDYYTKDYMDQGMTPSEVDDAIATLENKRTTEYHTLHKTYGMSFREIAALPAYAPIPHSTIADIYHGGRVPNKWRYKFGMPLIIKVRSDMIRKNRPTTAAPRNRRAINLTDPKSAAATILSSGATDRYIEQLVDLLDPRERGWNQYERNE